MKKALKLLFVTLLIALTISTTSFAHSGRTDSSGGHRDNKNASGLGSYHYHCGGNPPHLHDDGYCPYGSSYDGGSSSSSGSSTYVKKDTIKIVNAPKTLTVGASYELDYEIDFINDVDYSISSSDESVIAVDDNVLTAKSKGVATITIKTSNNSKSFTLTVKSIPVEKIEIKKSIKLQLNDYTVLNPVVKPSNATYKKLTYKSSNNTIVNVDKNGELEGVSIGTAIITITSSNNITSKVKVKVYEVVPDEIRVSKTFCKIESNNKDKIDIEILPDNTNNKDYEIAINDDNIIEVDETGNINPINDGNTLINITTWNGITKTVPVYVYHIPVKSVTIDTSQIDYFYKNWIDKNKSLDFTSYVNPSNATYKDLTWTSSNEDVIEIVNNIPKIKGTGTITLTANAHDDIENKITLKVVNSKLIITSFVLVIIGVICVIILFLNKKGIIQLPVKIFKVRK